MRLGVFGGTFDPPHLGHLLTAVDALEQLSLDRILLIPNAVQPLKGSAKASAQHRLEMLLLMAESDSRFVVEPVELERNGVSFTVDTLEELASRHPGARLFFLAGADVIATFSQWRNTPRILELATLAILSRTGVAGMSQEKPESQGLPAGAIRLNTRTIEISSTEIRERVRKGMPVRGFVTEGIERFIAERGLYQQGMG